MTEFTRIEKKGLDGFWIEASLPADRISLHITEIAPGTRAHPPHTHSGVETFYILSGSVRILKKGRLLREMVAGDYFGEMAMLLEVPRTAAAVAAAPDTRLVAISESNIETILRENPKIVVSFLKEMSGRLRSVNEKVDDLTGGCGSGEEKGIP